MKFKFNNFCVCLMKEKLYRKATQTDTNDRNENRFIIHNWVIKGN